MTMIASVQSPRPAGARSFADSSAVVALSVQPDPAQDFFCENGVAGLKGCTSDGTTGTVRFDVAISDVTDPAGLGTYDFTLNYDDTLFDPPSITDSGLLGSTGRSVLCSTISPLPTAVRQVCTSTEVLPAGPIWTGAMAVAHVVLHVQDVYRSAMLAQSDNAIVSRFDETRVGVLNGCHKPLNDGATVIPGQPRCDGVLLAGVSFDGSLADASSAFTLRRLEGDIDENCTVDIVDMQREATRFGFDAGSPIYSLIYDLEPRATGPDGIIDIKDVQFVFGRFGSNCSAPIPLQNPGTAPDS